MSRQVQEHFDQVVKSEMSLRTLNQELSASESGYRGLVDHAPIGICTTKGMQVTFSNRHNQILAGLDPDEQVDPASFRARIQPEDLDRVLSDFSRAVAASRQCELIVRFVHADGGVLTILSRRVPISDFDSPDPIYEGFNIDITALHELQLRLSRTEMLAMLGQMMDRIVNQIVEYARTRELALTQFTLSNLVNEVLKLLNGPLGAKHLKVRTSLSPPADRLHADRDQIEQVLLNVIGNAIDASPRHRGDIHLTSAVGEAPS
ncbi:MAG: PAS domain-containing protein [Nitrospirales bacterium]